VTVKWHPSPEPSKLTKMPSLIYSSKALQSAIKEILLGPTYKKIGLNWVCNYCGQEAMSHPMKPLITADHTGGCPVLVLKDFLEQLEKVS
jgi:protoporphyrinogen oxidase